MNLGCYHLQDKIGQGATSEVYLARDVRLERQVAVKVFRSSLAGDSDYLSRLWSEARSAARLSHPNIVTVYDAGQEAGVCYLVMEYVEGETLRQVLGRSGRLSLESVLDMALQLCQGLVHAHQRKVVHGDLKPGNLILTREGVVKIADFGLARDLKQRARAEEAVAGTLVYLAPEQLAGRGGDERTDLYATGVVLYELLAGQPPFPGRGVSEVVQGHLSARPRPLCAFRPDIPPLVEQVILKLLEKEPARRYRAAEKLLQALEDCKGMLTRDRSGHAGDEKTASRKWPLIGREEELTLLRRAVEGVSAGRGGLVLVEGEAGIGKTRLLEELAGDEAMRAAQILRGTCQEAGPYSAFVQILRSGLGVEVGELQACWEEEVCRHLRLAASDAWLPVLRRLLRSSPEQLDTGGETGSSQQLFWVVWQVLAAMAAEQPLILLLEDLHLADLGTVEMLDFIARQLGQDRVLVVATYRPEELAVEGSPQALRQLIGTAERLGLCRRVVLRRLRPEETGRLAAAFFGEAVVPADLMQRLQKESTGNPFFALEILRWMQGKGLVRWEAHRGWVFQALGESLSWIPNSVQQAIHGRFVQLAADDQEILRCAAVEGERFSSEALGCVLGIERLPLLRSLDRLEYRHRMVHYDGERYCFDHAKVREILSAEVSPELRRELHLLLAQYKEDQYQDRIEAVVFELAEHFYEAGVQEKAQHYLVRAGDQARGVYAHQQAISCYQRALELTQDGPVQAELLEKLADEFQAVGELGRALEHYGQLLNCGQEFARRAEVHRRLGNLCETGQRREEALQHLEQALKELSKEGDPVERAQVMIDLAYLYIAHFNDFGQAERLNHEGAALLEREPRHPGWLRLYHNLAAERNRQGCREEAMDFVRQRLELAEELGNLREVVLACLDLSYSYAVSGEGGSGEAMRWGQRAIDTARQIGDLRLAAEALARQGMWLLTQPQQADTGEAALQESRELCVRMGYPHPLAMILDTLVRHYLQSERAQEAKELGLAGIERLLDLGIEGIYLIRCFTRVLEGLQRACAQLGMEEEFAAFCRRMREERPRELEKVQPRQWLLEPAEPAFALPWQVVEEERWDQGSCPLSWSWTVDSRDPCQFQIAFGVTGLRIESVCGHQVIQDYERNCNPPRLVREIAGDWTASVQVAAVSGEVPKAGGVVAWRDADNYALLVVDYRSEVQLYAKEQGVFCLIGRGLLEGEAHWLGFQRTEVKLRALCSADGERWWTAGELALEGETLQVGIYPYPGGGRGDEGLEKAAQYGPFRIARVQEIRAGADTTVPGRDLHQEELAALCRISRTINATLDLEELLDQVIAVALEITGAERGLVLLAEGGRLQIAAAQDREGNAVENTAQISQQIVAGVVEKGLPVLALDAGEDKRFSPHESVVLHHIRSVLCLPLRSRGQLIGALYLDHRVQAGIFAEESLPFYETMADQIAMAVENARLYSQVRAENVYLRRQVESRYRFANILGESAPMRRVFALLEKVVESPAPVVILGESGTGKEVVARAIHYEGLRREHRFVAENCAALPEQLLENELFGHGRGAFTGADRDKRGLFEVADGGTLFLDEIAETSLAFQAKLLRALEEGEIRRLGETEPRKVEVRLLVATSKDLLEEVQAGRFRKELYYRLSVLTVVLPPLRERREDIPLLAEHFLRDYEGRTGKSLPGFSREVLKTMAQYDWPGNVRELRNEVERMAALAEPGAVIGRELLSERLGLSAAGGVGQGEGESLNQALVRIKREMIEEALRQCGGNRSRTAEQLGLSRSNLQMMMKRLGIR